MNLKRDNSVVKSSHKGMICKVGLLSDCAPTFNRFIEGCEICCEVITPHLLAAPFFRRYFTTLIIPTGFANPRYSHLLPALRAIGDRFARFVDDGGKVLVFGAADSNTLSYDWLPFALTYNHCYGERQITMENMDPFITFLEGYDTMRIPADGYFSTYDAIPIAHTEQKEVVMVVKKYGNGCIVATTIHEYPSQKFLQRFSCSEREILF